MAALLLDRGADVHARAISQWTPLHFTPAYGRLEVAGLLPDRCAQVEAMDANQRTPLHVAAADGPRSTAMTRLLLDRGGDQLFGRAQPRVAALQEGCHECVHVVPLDMCFLLQITQLLVGVERGMGAPGSAPLSRHPLFERTGAGPVLIRRAAAGRL